MNDILRAIGRCDTVYEVTITLTQNGYDRLKEALDDSHP